jgi:hypothetical protein
MRRRWLRKGSDLPHPAALNCIAKLDLSVRVVLQEKVRRLRDILIAATR